MLKLSTLIKVLAVSALTMGFGLMVIGSDAPAPVQPLPVDDNANWDLKDQLAPEHQDPEENVVPDQSTIDQKEFERLTKSRAHQFPLNLRATSEASEAQQYLHPLSELLFEGFNTAVPPTGWTTASINDSTWGLGTLNPFEGTGYAVCYYDDTYSGNQDEWLISPSIDLSTGGPWVMDFAWMMSYYWGVDPYDNYDMFVMVSDDDGATWTQAWTEPVDVFTSFEWYPAQISLGNSATFKFALVYQGYDGAQAGFDAISINDAAPPVGRCCYDVDFLTCVDNTEAECAVLGGHWNGFLDCSTPCPSVPPNDDWTTATEIYPPTTVTGSTENATLDCPGVLDWNAVWYVFEAPYGENDVDVDFCGTVPGLTTVGVVLYADPVVCADYILRTNYEWWTCADLEDNPHIWWDRLPGPATYYFPVYTGNAKVEQPFSFDITVDESAPLPPGGSCGDPFPLTLGSGDLPYTEAGLVTCGLGDAYNATCLGYYDGGEDFIMELTLTDPLDLNIKLDPKGLTYSGISIDDECPDADATCIDFSTSSGSGVHGMTGLTLAAGTYYIMVDTWPSPDCLPEFDLIFEPYEIQAGNNCGDPYIVKLPDDMVADEFIHTSYTCGRGNDYSTTCLGSYDGGEDMIYMLDVGSEMTVNITVSSASTWKGLSIDNECPDSDASCLDYATASSGDVTIAMITLTPGYYYLQVDTWPSPTCIPEFTLTIDIPGECTTNECWEHCDALGGEVVDLAFNTTGALADGPQGCMYGPNLWYCYTPDVTGMGHIALCGSSFDTKVAVYDGVDPFTATMIGCDDDGCAKSLQSELFDIPMIKDEVYLIEVGGYSTNAGAGILNVTVDTCTVPDNDNCEGVTPVTLLHGNVVTFTGDNTCATNQCASFPGGHTWEAFTLPTQMDVTLDYCTNSPAWGNAWLNLAYGCPCDSFSPAGAYDFTTCGDGNVTIMYDDLPAGTYYYPVLKDPAYGAVGPYTIHVVGYAPSQLVPDQTAIDFGTQPAGSVGNTTLNLTADGPGDINFTTGYLYNVKSANHSGWAPFGTTEEEKPPYSGPEYVPPTEKQGGDDIATATVVGALPYSNSGTTDGYINDYDEVCPYSGSTSPDVVYSFAPGAAMAVDITLCVGSTYDTKLYVYENSAGNVVACNDDACPGYVSELLGVVLGAGNTYYIVIDGYGGDYGDYTIDITEAVIPTGRCCVGTTCSVTTEADCAGDWNPAYDCSTPCPSPFECPPGAHAEAETCGADVNGGCNGGTFEPIACGDTVCGTSWFDGSTRDTDWYTVEFFVETEVTFVAQAEFDMLMGFVDTSDCALASAVAPYALAAPDEFVSVTRTCGPGVYWLFVAPQFTTTFACGSFDNYWCALTCPEGPVLWLSSAPQAGTIPGGGTLPITVSYDATELDLGVYSADLKFTHDGRSVTLVPVTLTIGTVVPPDTMVLDPDPIGAFMENEAVNVDGHIYIGDDLGMVNPDMGSMEVGNGRATIPCAAEYIGYYPGLTNPVMMLTFDLGDFAAMYNEGLMWDCDTRSYTVTGTDDGGPFAHGDDFTYCGHVSGDLNLDGAIDISDLVLMVDWMFTGGDAPEVLLTADCDGNGTIDIGDLVALVDFMFNGGSAPQHN